MKLFDCHCDTLTELRRRGETLEKNTCQVSFPLAFGAFEEYSQVLAVWSEDDVDGEENYRRFHLTLDYAEPMLTRANFHPVLAVEGGKLLCGQIGRLTHLYNRGVRILTLVWKGVCCVGGAYDTDAGLTDFGRETVETCLALGIVPDLSHASDRMFEETAAIAESRRGTILVSHSCARALCPHPRNLTDGMAKRTASLGGVIGVNLVPDHLGGRCLGDVVRHIFHLAEKAGDDHIALGCDFDGTDALPEELPNIGALPRLWDALCKKVHSERFTEKIFYSNAQNFAKAHFTR